MLIRSNTADAVTADDMGLMCQVTCVWSFCREVQLEHALLLYFAGQHANAIEELEQYKAGCAGREGAEIDVLLSKLSYIKTEKTDW